MEHKIYGLKILIANVTNLIATYLQKKNSIYYILL